MAEAAASVGFRLGDQISRLEDHVYKLSLALQEQNVEVDSFQPSIQSVRDRNIADITRKYDHYKPPLMTNQEYLEYSNLFYKHEHRKSLSRARDKSRMLYETELDRRGPQIFRQDDPTGNAAHFYHEDYDRVAVPPGISDTDRSVFRTDRQVVYDNDAQIAVDLVTLASFDRPLRYNRPVTLDIIADQICLFSHTKIPDLVRTYNNILDRCFYGCHLPH